VKDEWEKIVRRGAGGYQGEVRLQQGSLIVETSDGLFSSDEVKREECLVMPCHASSHLKHFEAFAGRMLDPAVQLFKMLVQMNHSLSIER
jgi:hypothetical protein